MQEVIPFINEIVSIIVARAAPDRIILFGSFARGEAGEKSDIDLLILKKNLKNGRIMVNNLYRDFYEHKIGVSVDIISLDLDRYEELNKKTGFIYKTINEEGKVLYAAA